MRWFPLLTVLGIQAELVVSPPSLGQIATVWIVCVALLAVFARHVHVTCFRRCCSMGWLELVPLLIGAQLVLDWAAPHLGDVLVLTGHAGVIAFALRADPFPTARLLRRPHAPRSKCSRSSHA